MLKQVEYGGFLLLMKAVTVAQKSEVLDLKNQNTLLEEALQLQ